MADKETRNNVVKISKVEDEEEEYNDDDEDDDDDCFEIDPISFTRKLTFKDSDVIADKSPIPSPDGQSMSKQEKDAQEIPTSVAQPKGRPDEGVIEVLSSDEEEERRARLAVDYSGVEVWTAEERRREEEECCILDGDPFAPQAILDFKLKLAIHDRQEDELIVIAERGQVACRDYPHSRHLCAKFPFHKTVHESCCPLCYCYICDTAAPCNQWKGSYGHCHASDKDKKWTDMRIAYRPSKPSQVAAAT